MSNPFENMTLEDARKNDLWDFIQIDISTEGDERRVAVSMDGLLAEVRVNADLLLYNGEESLPTFVRERLEMDFQELAMLMQHKIAEAVTLAQ